MSSSVEFTMGELNALYASMLFVEKEIDDAILLKYLIDAREKITVALKAEWAKRGHPDITLLR